MARWVLLRKHATKEKEKEMYAKKSTVELLVIVASLTGATENMTFPLSVRREAQRRLDMVSGALEMRAGN